MENWQIILFVFLVLLPMVLMIDFWGDERVTFRGRPNKRDWRRQVEPMLPPDDGHH